MRNGDTKFLIENLEMIFNSFVWTVLCADALAISCDSHAKDQMPEKKMQGLRVWTVGMLLWVGFLLGWLVWSADLFESLLVVYPQKLSIKLPPSGLGVFILSCHGFDDEHPQFRKSSYGLKFQARAKNLDSAFFLIRMRPDPSRVLSIRWLWGWWLRVPSRGCHHVHHFSLKHTVTHTHTQPNMATKKVPCWHSDCDDTWGLVITWWLSGGDINQIYRMIGLYIQIVDLCTVLYIYFVPIECKHDTVHVH